MPSDEARGIRGEEYRGASKLIELPESLHRSSDKEFPPPLGSVEQGSVHVGPQNTRHKRVEAYTELRPLDSERLGERSDGSFAGAIGGDLIKPDKRRKRTNINDAAVAALDHVPSKYATGAQRAFRFVSSIASQSESGNSRVGIRLVRPAQFTRRSSLSGAFSATLSVQPRALPAVFVGGLVVGVLDLAYAILVYSPRKPILIPQTIASGILGMRAYDGGAQTAALGVALHFVIAFGAATVFYLVSRKLSFMIQRAVLSGLIYGGLVYLFMHLVILPLSAAPHGHMPIIYKACEFVEHWFCVGLPIALSVRHYSR